MVDRQPFHFFETEVGFQVKTFLLDSLKSKESLLAHTINHFMASGKKEMVNTAAAAYDNNSVEKPTVQHNSHKIHKRHPFRRALPAITFIIVWLLTLAASTLPGWLKVSTTWVGYSHLNSSTTTSTTTSPFSNSVSVWFICLPDNSAASTTQFFSTLSNLDLTLPNSDTYLSLPWIINITGQFPGCVFVNYWKNQFLVMRIAVLSSLFFGFWGVIKLLGKPYDYVSGLFYLSFHGK